MENFSAHMSLCLKKQYGGDGMKIGNGMVYGDNYARAAAYYLGTCAPEPSEQYAEAYNFIKAVYGVFANNASEAGYKAFEDKPFVPWEGQKGRENDVRIIRNAVKDIDEVIAQLYAYVKQGEVSENKILLADGTAAPKKRFVKVMSMAGAEVLKDNGYAIVFSHNCAAQLKLLADIAVKEKGFFTDSSDENRELVIFSRAVFSPEKNWTAQAFDRCLEANGEIVRLCDALEKLGYSRVDCREGRKITLDYYKQYGKKQEPLKAAWAERSHTGIELLYDDICAEPFVLSVRMPEYKKVLSSYENIPADTIKFICDNTKTCDGCRYCVQTDKTGTRPLACVKINGTSKCPYYPGFSYRWRNIFPGLTDNVIKLLETVDGIIK